MPFVCQWYFLQISKKYFGMTLANQMIQRGSVKCHMTLSPDLSMQRRTSAFYLSGIVLGCQSFTVPIWPRSKYLDNGTVLQNRLGGEGGVFPDHSRAAEKQTDIDFGFMEIQNPWQKRSMFYWYVVLMTFRLFHWKISDHRWVDTMWLLGFK